jgi:pSer/pThr/pTyr-binding forkhead associated (FHA) protein
MVQLNILSGKKAGDQPVVRRFPLRIGRAAENHLQLEDDGVWDQHLALEFRRQEGFMLIASPEALATVNHQPVRSVLLRNGDIIAIGSAKFQFWLGATRQRGLRAREFCVWLLIAAVTAVQITLVYWLIR